MLKTCHPFIHMPRSSREDNDSAARTTVEYGPWANYATGTNGKTIRDVKNSQAGVTMVMWGSKWPENRSRKLSIKGDI